MDPSRRRAGTSCPALDLVEVDTERDHGSYVETNLWMRHA
jgi:hypothetical protein